MPRGRKNDVDKLRFDLVPPEAIEALARALTYGANKYDDRDWEHGMAWGRLFAAAMRHLWTWWRGVELDEESGLHHLDHALASVAMLATLVERAAGEDDRWTS